MSDDDDPRAPLTDALARIQSRVASRPRLDADDDYDDPTFDDVRAEGVEAMRDARWADLIPSRFRWARVSDFVGSVGDDLAEWGRHNGGRNLVLLGPVGTGKTTAAVGAARVCHDRGLVVRFWPVVELLDQLRPGGPDGALYDLAAVDVLVIDDLGSERPTDWTAERLYALVNRRWMEERPTIVTSNLPATRKSAPAGWDGDVLEDAVGARLFSRLVGNDSLVMRLAGEDRRRSPRPS